MKLWQLSAVIEKEIFNRYFGGLYDGTNGKIELDETLVLTALGESSLWYYVTSHNYLRLMPEKEDPVTNGFYTVATMTVLDAYKKYGGDAITEVMDYGSFPLARLNEKESNNE